MRDCPEYRHSATRYWERRRIIYNLALVPPSALAYLVMAGAARVGDDYNLHPYYVVLLFALSALGANICYTFAYALEFFFGSDDPATRWQRFGRATAFASGTLFAVLLAAIGGREIALMEFYYR